VCDRLVSSLRKLLDELERVQTIDVAIPVVNGPRLRLRCVAQTDEHLACLLERLELRLPARLRIHDVVDADSGGMRASGSAVATTQRPVLVRELFSSG
jgi:hypothetical protein